MPEEKNSTVSENVESQEQLTLEQQNHHMLKEILRTVRWTRRIHATSLIITITFIVLPLISAIVILPRVLRSFTGVLSQYGQDSGIAPNGSIFDLLKQLQQQNVQPAEDSSLQ